MSLQQVLPQCPVCGAIGGYELSGIVGKYAKCPQCQTKWKLLFEKEQLGGLMLHELPKNGSALFKVNSTNAPLFVELGKPIALGFWQTLRLDGKIDWNFLSSTIDPTILHAIIIDKSEIILNAWTGNRQTQSAATYGPQAKAVVLQVGALLLTSRRLIWLERRQIGVWKPQITYQVAVETCLENIKGVYSESGDSGNFTLLRKVSVVTNDGENTFNLQGAFQELLKPAVETAIKMRRDEMDAEKRKDKIHVMLDFSFLKTMMEKGGLVMQVLKCPECGASVDFPRTGNQTVCNHCGKAIYAQDIFEKVKGLI